MGVGSSCFLWNIHLASDRYPRFLRGGGVGNNFFLKSVKKNLDIKNKLPIFVLTKGATIKVKNFLSEYIR